MSPETERVMRFTGSTLTSLAKQLWRFSHWLVRQADRIDPT